MTRHRFPGRVRWLGLLLFLLPVLALPCDLNVNIGRRGEMIPNNFVRQPLPPQFRIRDISPDGVRLLNQRNSGMRLEVDVEIDINARLGVHIMECFDPSGGPTATGPFTVLDAQPTPTPTPTATPPAPTPTPTPTSPGATPTPSPTSPGPLPTPPEGTLRIAPDTTTEGTQSGRHIIAAATASSSSSRLAATESAGGFDRTTTVTTPADIRLDRLNVLSPTRLEIFISNRLGTPSGPRVFFVSTPGVPSGTGTVVVTVIPARSLAAPLSVQTAAILSPRRGTFVALGERLFARALLAVTGTGTVTGSWKLDGVPFERFEVPVFGGEPVSVVSKVPIPASMEGDHFLTLEVDHPQSVAAENVLLVFVSRRGARIRLIEPADGAVLAAPRVFRWTLVPGAQAYEIVFASEAQELPGSPHFRVSGGVWKPTARQWKAIGEGTRFWAVRAIFPVDVRGPLTPWQRIEVTPEKVAMELLPSRVERDSGAVLLVWRGGAPGLLYRVIFFDRPAGAPLFSALTFQTRYRLRRALIRGSPDVIYYRVEALAPSGRSPGATPAAALDLPGEPASGKLVRTGAVSLSSHDPPVGGTWSLSSPAIGVRWKGRVESSEIVLFLDGADVTPLAEVAAGEIRYVPPLALEPGAHRVLLKLGETVSSWEVLVKARTGAGTPAGTTEDPRAGLGARASPSAQSGQIPPREPEPPPLADEGFEADRNLEWKVEVSGIVTVKSEDVDTAHLTLSSAASFYKESAWSLEGSVELAGHHDFDPQHTVQDSRSWLIRGGVGDEERFHADALVGYSPPEAVEGLQLLTAGFARGGVEGGLKTPLGKFSGYTTFDDKLSGLFTSTYPGSQKITLGSYDAPLPSDRFLLRGLYMEVEEEGRRGGFVSPSMGKGYGGIGRWAASRAFALTFEGARTELELGPREDLRGDAFRLNLQGTIKRTSYALNLHQTDAEFSNLANRGLTAAGQADRRGGDLGLSVNLGKVTTGVAYRYLEGDSDPAQTESHAGSLTLALSLSKKVKATATGLWSLDTGRATPGARGPLPRLDRTQAGGRLLLTETLGRFSLSQNFSWNELDDRVSANNDVETTAVNLTANGNLARALALNLSVGATRSERALSGNNDSVVVLFQPRWTISALRLSLTPRASYSYSASDASPVSTRGESYQGILSWTVFRGKVQPILGASGEWFRTRAGSSSSSDFDHRYVGTLTIRWGASGERSSASSELDLPPPPLPATLSAGHLPRATDPALGFHGGPR